MNVMTRSMAPGAASLPAELIAGRAGVPVTGQSRLMLGQRGGAVEAEPFTYRTLAGFGDILNARFVVPQNPVVVRNSSGTSGVGRMRQIARLRGIGGLGQTDDDGSDDTLSPTDLENLAGAVGPSDTALASQSLDNTLIAAGSGYTVGADSAGDTVLTSPNGVQTTFPPGTTPVPIGQVSGGAASGYTAAIPQYGIPVGVVGAPAGYAGPVQVAAGASTPAAPTGYQWAQVTNSAGQTLTKVLAVSQGGAAITLPNGNQLLYGSAASAATAGVAGALTGTGITNLLPLLLIGGAVLLLMRSGK
jgi:hypothetical protein